MITHRAILLAAGLLLADRACASPPQPASIAWSIEAAGPVKDGTGVQLTIDSRWTPESRSTWSDRYNVAALRGLTRAQVLGAPQPARFTLAREAGRLACSGTVGGGR